MNPFFTSASKFIALAFVALVMQDHGNDRPAALAPRRFESTCLIIDFKAVSTNAATDIIWTTQTESALSKFVVERSVDGVLFKPVASICAAGTSSGELQYRHSDAIRPSGELYYRLASVDASGKFTVVAGPLLVQNPQSGISERFTFSLVQVDNTSSLIFPGFANTLVTVSVADLAGNNLLRTKLLTDEQGISEPFVCNCQTGIYFVSVVVNGIMRSRALTIGN